MFDRKLEYYTLPDVKPELISFKFSTVPAFSIYFTFTTSNSFTEEMVK
jgi:hypothetical protein